MRRFRALPAPVAFDATGRDSPKPRVVSAPPATPPADEEVPHRRRAAGAEIEVRGLVAVGVGVPLDQHAQRGRGEVGDGLSKHRPAGRR